MTDRLERRASVAAVVASIGIFLALYLVLPPSFETPDEAKYVGLGLNALAGHGLVTDFGVRFLSHPPLWPVILAGGQRWLGIDAMVAGHVLEAISAAAVIAFAAALAWRFRPAAAATAAAVLLTTPYVMTLARTAGIDLPAAAFSLAYLWVAWRAIDRGSIRLGLAAGLLFGIAFLIKETVIPFAPIPFLAALAGRRDGPTVARVGAAALLTASLVAGPWMALYANLTGTIYRAGGPPWLLVPVAVAVALLILAGLAAARLAAWPPARRITTAGLVAADGRWRPALSWGALAAWLAVQLLIYSRAAKLAGESVVRVPQLAADAAVYLPQIGTILGFGVVGSLLAVRYAGRRTAVQELAAATIAQLPLIVLVLGIGETPRHYVATLGLLATLGAVGWIEAVEHAAAIRGRLTLLGAAALALLIALPQLLRASPLVALAATAGVIAALAILTARFWGPPALTRRTLGGTPLLSAPVAVFALLIMATAVAAGTAYRASRTANAGSAEAPAIAAIRDWVRSSLPPGATVMVSPALAYDIALATHGEHTVVRVRPQTALIDAAAPLGLRLANGRPVTDPASIEGALHVVDHVDVYAAGAVQERVRAVRPAIWIEAAYVPGDARTSPVIAAFDAAQGMHRAASWSFAYAGHRLLVVAFAIDPDRFALGTATIYALPAAVEVLARGLAPNQGGRDAAGTLLARVAAVPEGVDADAAVERLRRVSEGLPPG